MKYFIDFEATQFTQEIISIGCINELGEEFSSLVRPTEGKITSFITSLTGITKEMMEEAPTADFVFSLFWDWIKNDSLAPEFVCYGNCDKRFVENTLKHVKSLKAKAALLLINDSIKDFAPVVTKTFKLAGSLSLKQLYEYYFKPEVQRHDAMEDATWLKAVFDRFDDTDKNDFLETFHKYTKAAVHEEGRKVYCKDLDMEFPSISKAGAYVFQNMMKGNKSVKKANVVKKLSKCLKNGIPYCGMEWTFVDEEGKE